MPFRRSTIFLYAIAAAAYLALAVMYLVADRPGYAVLYLIFTAGWAALARLATKIPADMRAHYRRHDTKETP